MGVGGFHTVSFQQALLLFQNIDERGRAKFAFDLLDRIAPANLRDEWQ
jgi:hypothetical protein